MTGRPSTYDRETADAILESIIGDDKLSLTVACAQVETEAFPNGLAKGTFLGWVVDDVDGLSDRYMRAKKIRVFNFADEIVDIADDASKDFIDTEKGRRVDPEALGRTAQRIDVRKFLMVRVCRNEFGDKVEVGGSIGIDVAGASAGLAAKLGVDSASAGAKGTPEGGSSGG